METFHDLVLLIVLIILSGVFSASETALTAFKSISLEEISDKNPKTGKMLKEWLKKPNDMLTALLLGNNIVNILATSLATAFITQFLAENDMSHSKGVSVFISTAVMTTIILIFGEITPKIIAKNNSSKISSKVIKPIYILSKITKPIIIILTGISKLISRIIGIEINDEMIMITEEDIISYINVGEAEGIIEEEEKDMIQSIVNFGETSAKEVMTPRTSVYAIEGNKTINEIWDDITQLGYSRIPVYNGVLEDVIGLLYVKDLLNAVKEGKIDHPVKEFVRKAFFVPETKPVLKILADFKDSKVHMAIVVDEYGGIVGVVTIEDVVEEIFGEIRDEYDKEEDSIKDLGNDEYEIDARLDIETINKELNVDLPISEDYESLGGLILNELDEMAKVGDIVTLDNIKLKVKEIKKTRISKIILRKKGDKEQCPEN
ncbi:hemolysin family protein [Fusobacterium sp. MFO224]|uniref:hemolysin family protein n=1 Tax=Fusobacterium sp. MFO224 TaxID=3378070 RepID=UPI0038536453